MPKEMMAALEEFEALSKEEQDKIRREIERRNNAQYGFDSYRPCYSSLF